MSALDSFINKFGGMTADYTELPEGIQPDATAAFMVKFGGTPMQTYWFYDNTVELKFDEETWTYFLVEELGNLTPQYGVTNIIKIIDKSAMLVPWASKMAIEKLLRIVPVQTISTGPEDPSPLNIVPSMSLAEFTRLALEAKSAHRERLEDAGAVGHQAHQFLEEWINAGLSGNTEEQTSMLKSIGVTWQEL